MNFYHRTFKIVCFAIAVLVSLDGCQHNPAKNDDTEPQGSVPHMRKINSKNTFFMQGASDSLAGSDEKPVLKQRFTYSYYMDTVEVTQGMYREIMGVPSGQDFSTYGKGDDYPVYYVSWFDAVLFCNTRSKAEKLDTVYSWSGQPFKEGGSVYDLTGLSIHYDRDGYRLPTESEWEYAAREGSSVIPFPGLQDTAGAGKNAWYSWNADGKIHPVASKKANVFGLYDMAGNVFEWTGDWKGFYSADSVINSLGSRYHNDQYERVVKGGAFTHGFINLRPSRRSATYATSHAIKTEYIGFRCVRGVIPGGNYIGQNSAAVHTNPVTLLVHSLQPITGSVRSKLVFVNVSKTLRTLCYVDFSETSPQIYEFDDSLNVYMPVISPDGAYAAYGTSGSGIDGKADVFIRKLHSPSQPPSRIPSEKAFSPRWWIDPLTSDTCVVFTNSTINNASAQWPATGTYKVQFSNGQVAGPITQVTSQGGFHGGISVDGNFAVTGCTRLLRKDLKTNEILHMFVSPKNGKTAEGSYQVCNVSVCPKSAAPHRCMFLDFGAPGGSSLTGAVYGLHEYLFISDFSGNVLKWYKYPEGESSWEYPEWSNNERFAAACAGNAADESHAVYCVDLRDSLYMKLIEGTVIQDPYLWTDSAPDTSGNLNPDSLGCYNDPPLFNGQDFFTLRMHDFWQYRDSMEIVAVGSSHLCHALDPRNMPKNKVYNMAFIDCMNKAMFIILEKYLLPHCPRLKFIIIDIFLGGMNATDEWCEGWNKGIFNSKGFVYDKQHEFWSSGIPANFIQMMAKAPGPPLPQLDPLGVYHTASNGWGGKNPPTPYAADWTITSENHVRNLGQFKTFIQKCAGENIKILLVITPESPEYKNTGYFMRYGPAWDNGVEMVKQIRDMADSLPNCHFYDAYNAGNHDYTDADAYDSDHLSETGAKKFSARIDSVISTIRR